MEQTPECRVQALLAAAREIEVLAASDPDMSGDPRWHFRQARGERVQAAIQRLKDALAGMERCGVPAAGPWVKVSERLPSNAHPAVIVSNGDKFDRAIWDGYWMGTRLKNITHWAEIILPEVQP